MSELTIDQHDLFCRANEPVRRTAALASGVAGLYSARSPFKDSDNEDSAALVPVDETRGMLAVADGVGGQPGGAAAAELALVSLAEEVAKIRAGDIDLRHGIMEAIERANHQIMEMGIGAATTLAVIEIDGGAVRPYHVGDSMILVVGQRGKMRHQTIPHSPVGYAIEAGLLDERDAIHHADRHVVSNVLGTPDMRIEVGSVIRLKAYDTVLVASDGIFDNLHVSEVVEAIRTKPIPKVVNALATAAQTRMLSPTPGHPSKPDDTTFIAFRRRMSARTQRADGIKPDAT